MDQDRCGTAVDYLREAAELFCQLGSAVLETEARLATARALIRKGDLAEAGALLQQLDEEGMRADHSATLRYLRALLQLEAFRAGGEESLLRKARAGLRQAVSDESGLQRIPEVARRWLELAEAEELAGGREAGLAARRRAADCVRRLLDGVPSERSRSVLEKLPVVAGLLG